MNKAEFIVRALLEAEEFNARDYLLSTNWVVRAEAIDRNFSGFVYDGGLCVLPSNAKVFSSKEEAQAEIHRLRAESNAFGLVLTPVRKQSVREAEEDEEAFDAREYLLGSFPVGHKIRITFSRMTPRGEGEDADEEHGWIDEEGKSMDPDQFDVEDGKGPVDLAVEFLNKEGAYHASSSFFHSGIWYSTDYQTIDYGTGTEEERSYHLINFTEEEERQVYNEIALKI